MGIEAKNALENYCFSLKSSIAGEDNIQGKMSESDKSLLESKIEDTIRWLDENQNAEIEEYQEKQTALTEIATPILQSSMAGNSGGVPFSNGSMPGTSGFAAGGMPGGPPGAASSASPPSNDAAGGPTIEEID